MVLFVCVCFASFLYVCSLYVYDCLLLSFKAYCAWETVGPNTYFYFILFLFYFCFVFVTHVCYLCLFVCLCMFVFNHLKHTVVRGCPNTYFYFFYFHIFVFMFVIMYVCCLPFKAYWAWETVSGVVQTRTFVGREIESSIETNFETIKLKQRNK
jgi:hypothetical protein